jgi:hypothetical protein
MMIVEAVKAAIEADCGDSWADLLPQVARLPHQQHVRYTQSIDAWDIRAFNQLSRVGRCHRARLAHSERPDGSLRPRLIVLFGEWDGTERRIGERRGVEFRREAQEVA